MLLNLKKSLFFAALLFIVGEGYANASYSFAPPPCDYLSRSFPIVLKSVASDKSTYLFNIIYVIDKREDVFPVSSVASAAPAINTDNSSQIKCLDTSCYAEDFWSKPAHPGMVSQYRTIANDSEYKKNHIYSISGELGPGHASSNEIVWIPSRNLRLLTVEVFNANARGGHNVDEGYTRPLLIQYRRSAHETVSGDMVGSLTYRGLNTPVVTFQPHSVVGLSYLPEQINMIDFASMAITLNGSRHPAANPGGVEPHAEVISYTHAPRASRFSSADINTVKAYLSRCAIKR